MAKPPAEAEAPPRPEPAEEPKQKAKTVHKPRSKVRARRQPPKARTANKEPSREDRPEPEGAHADRLRPPPGVTAAPAADEDGPEAPADDPPARDRAREEPPAEPLAEPATAEPEGDRATEPEDGGATEPEETAEEEDEPEGAEASVSEEEPACVEADLPPAGPEGGSRQQPVMAVRYPLQGLGAGALLIAAVAAPTVLSGAAALEVLVAVAGITIVWLALVAFLVAAREGWRAGVEEILVLAGAVITVVAGAQQIAAGETGAALAAAPAIATGTWLGRWIEAMLRGQLVSRLCRRADAPEEADDLARLSPRLWGDSRAETTATRGWDEPAGSKPLGNAPCPGKVDTFTRVAAFRGDGAATIGRLALRAGLYLVIAVPMVVAALLVYFAVGEHSSSASSLLLAAGTVLALSPRGLRRSWVGPMLAAADRGAVQGILFRDGAALEATAGAHWVVFDSRGTLTWGEPGLTSVVAVGSLDDEEILSLAAGAEKAAGDNPLGVTIVRTAEERGLEPAEVRLARHNPGLGISATSPRGDLLVGTRQLLLGQGISVAEADEIAAEMESRAETVVFVAVGGRVQGVISLRDELRPGAKRVAKALSTLGVEPVLMTGDSRPKADALGHELGFEHIRAEVSPEEWSEQVASLRGTEHGIAMVARPPRHEDTLAAADVGITLGGDGLAVDTAGVALESEDPTAAVEAVAIARAALRAARINLFVSATQILIGMGLAWLSLGLLQAWAVPGLVALLSSATAALVASETMSGRDK